MVLDHVSLWSVSGMGLRCDLCSEVFLLKTSDVSIKPGSLRPMSITADAMYVCDLHPLRFSLTLDDTPGIIITLASVLMTPAIILSLNAVVSMNLYNS